MGNVIISLDEKRENELRKMAREDFGGKKGSLSSVVSAAIDELSNKSRRQRAINSQIKLMERGLDLGLGKSKAYEKRSEIYD